jgi:hypothetical protein
MGESMTQFEIYDGEKIEVQCNGKVFLRGEPQKGLRYRVRLSKDDSFILEWALPAILLFRRVEVMSENLPFPILSARHRGLFSFEVTFGEDTMVVRIRPFRKAYCFIYFNGEKIGEVYFAKKLMLGYRQFRVVSNTDDETINLYVVISFLLQLWPV